MVASLLVTLNASPNKYVVANHLTGPLKGSPRFVTDIVPPFREGLNVSGLPQLVDVPGVSTLIFPNFIDGLGRDRIDSDSAKKLAEYRRFNDATGDTRFARQVTLPILKEDSTETGLEIIRASSSFKSNLWAAWEDGTSTQILARKYVGSTTSWDAGGRVLTVPTFDAATTSTTDGFSHTTTTRGGRFMLLAVLASTEPSSITYDGVSMTKITSGSVSSLTLAVWKLTAPSTGSNTVTLTGEGGIVEIAVVTYSNVDQTTPVETESGANGTSTAPSVSASTAGGRLVFDAMGANGSGSATVGSDQTERVNVVNNQRLACSEEDGNASSVTMSWTLASSVAWRTFAVPINGGGIGVGLDMHPHKNRLLSLNVFTESHTVSFSTDGATWLAPITNLVGNLLANDITANEDIDAGLLETVGNEAVSIIWDEDSGTITFFSSSDAGDNWTDETLDISSGNGPQGVAVMAGIDNADKLYVGTREGLYEVDTSPSTWTADLIFPMVGNSDNCRRMKVGQNGALWFAQGVDDDSLPIVYNMFTHNGVREFTVVPNDFSSGDGLPAARLGPIRWMEPAQKMMYVGMGGGKSGRNASIFCHNGRGWHSMRKHGTANQKIEWIAASGDDDGTPRLHYAIRTASGTSDTVFLAQPFVNPSTGVSIKRESSGYIDLPTLDAGFPGDNGAWLQVLINAENLSAANTGEYINVDYGVDDGSGGLQARTTTDLGDFLSGTTRINFPSTAGGTDNGAGRSSVNLGLRVNLHRDGTTNTDTPQLKDVRIAVLKEPPIRDRFSFTIDVLATMELTGRTAENIITDWETARDLITLPTFTYGPVTTARYVKVRQATWNMVLVSGSPGGAASVQNMAQVQREGFIIVVLEEVV